jgi:hypothetical protein
MNTNKLVNEDIQLVDETLFRGVHKAIHKYRKYKLMKLWKPLKHNVVKWVPLNKWHSDMGTR